MVVKENFIEVEILVVIIVIGNLINEFLFYYIFNLDCRFKISCILGVLLIIGMFFDCE